MNAHTLSSAATIAVLTLMTGCREHPEGVHAEGVESAAPVAQRVTMSESSPQLRQIHVDTVRERSFAVDEVVAPARIELNPNRVSRVMLPVAGRIVTTLVHIGDSVSRGQPMLQLESSDADSAVSTVVQAEASVVQAKAAYRKAKADYDRLTELLAQDAVAKKDVLAAEAALSQAEAGMEQADATRQQAQARVALLGLRTNQPHLRIDVAAPISGKVLEMSAVAGEFRNDTSTPVMTIADLSSVWISSDVPENQIREIRVDEVLQVELTAWPAATFQAKVTRIADIVDPATRTVKVYAELPNPRGQLKPEMFGRVRHVSETHSLAAVPAGAVIEGAGSSYVFREVQPGTFERTPVTIAGRTRDFVGISSGLTRGAHVVVDGAMLLKTY